MGTWRKYYPNRDNKFKDIPSILQGNFDALEDAYDIEHYSPASANAVPGAHRLGAVGAIYQGTDTEIASSSPVSGALAYDTTVGILRRYDGTSWNAIGSNSWSRFRAYLSGTVAVTAGASAETIIYNVEDYDTLEEYDHTTGLFTAKASGYYMVVAQASMVASGTQLDSAVVSATNNIGAYGWEPSGSSTNYENIDEYPEAVDTDFNTTQTSGVSDLFSGSMPSLPEDPGLIYVTIRFRSRRRGCTCDNTCYSQGCTCNDTCYGQSCSCYNTSYGGGSCSCNNTCYGDSGYGCTCDYTCYGYTTCSCNNTCYSFTCDCNATVYGSGAGCSCDSTCYSEDATRPAVVLRKNDTNYAGETIIPTAEFVDYFEQWTDDPSTGLPWTSSGASAIQGFGYTSAEGTVGCSADISQCYLQLGWFPSRPVVGVHIYKNDNLYQSTYRPIKELGAVSCQTANIFSIVYLSAGDTIKIAYTKTMEDDVLYGDSSLTYLAINRLPVDCL